MWCYCCRKIFTVQKLCQAHRKLIVGGINLNAVRLPCLHCCTICELTLCQSEQMTKLAKVTPSGNFWPYGIQIKFLGLETNPSLFNVILRCVALFLYMYIHLLQMKRNLGQRRSVVRVHLGHPWAELVLPGPRPSSRPWPRDNRWLYCSSSQTPTSSMLVSGEIF